MKENKFKILFTVFIAIVSLASCLKKGDMNIDPEKTTGSVMELQFIENGSGSTINSGMQYFGGGALTYPGTDDADTANYNISLAGPVTLGKDLTVSVGVDPNKALDNFSSDSIKYEVMPDSLYDFIETTATIKAGERIAPMKIIFYPSKMDPTVSYILPVVIKDAEGQTISGNFSTIYFHVIGNPIAGAYLWNYYRWNTASQPVLGTYPSGNPSGWEGEPTTFVPLNPTTIKVITGYYYQIDYNISFKNSNGVLSDFSVKFDKDQYDTYFAANGVTLVGVPSITVSPDYKEFEIDYIVYNGSAYRYIVDQFHK
ncbi:MAG: hypothetical protein JWR61_5519 [Ferruginibacter sp.]|uniref:DUF1735 domain-containing protein n=1 Tax=Ferruginibacter sp. TaxID=1940288 RepID=UPI00265A5A79|nr:DUF1735 domain-containing protein [Ferruginibacter sp.]MDB5280564.1 hypothetical protein [Ferruginibacter sp.]